MNIDELRENLQRVERERTARMEDVIRNPHSYGVDTVLERVQFLRARLEITRESCDAYEESLRSLQNAGTAWSEMKQAPAYIEDMTANELAAFELEVQLELCLVAEERDKNLLARMERALASLVAETGSRWTPRWTLF